MGEEGMKKVMLCKNCAYYESFGDPMNPRLDGICNKLRLTSFGFVSICTQEDRFCSLFKKKNVKEV